MKDIKIRINRLSYFIIFIMMLLEAITVPLVAFSDNPIYMGATKIPWHGFVIGAIGTITVFLVINQIVLRRYHLSINSEKILYFYSLVSLGFWGGLILFFIFLIQLWFSHLYTFFTPILYLFLSGFFSACGSIFLVTILYITTNSYATALQINVVTYQNRFVLANIDIFLLSLLIGVYEAFALPSIWTTYMLFKNAIFSGLVGGLMGSVMMLIFFQLIAKNKIQLTFFKIKK